MHLCDEEQIHDFVLLLNLINIQNMFIDNPSFIFD